MGTTKTNTRHINDEGIYKLQSAGNWRVIEYRAKYAKGKVAKAAADALLRTDRSVALSRVVSYRLFAMYSEKPEGTDTVVEHVFGRIIDSGNVHHSYIHLFNYIRRFDPGSELSDKLYTMLRGSEHSIRIKS